MHDVRGLVTSVIEAAAAPAWGTIMKRACGRHVGASHHVTSPDRVDYQAALLQAALGTRLLPRKKGAWLMEQGPLHKTLQQLHRELEHAEEVEDTTRELLQSLMGDIQKVLEGTSGQSSPQHRALIERLKDATQHFEDEHPRLTTAVGRVIDTLSNMGI